MSDLILINLFDDRGVWRAKAARLFAQLKSATSRPIGLLTTACSVGPDFKEFIRSQDGKIYTVDPIWRWCEHYHPFEMTKLRAWCLTQWDRILVLDADLTLKEDGHIDDMFNNVLVTRGCPGFIQGRRGNEPLCSGCMLLHPNMDDWFSIINAILRPPVFHDWNGAHLSQGILYTVFQNSLIWINNQYNACLHHEENET